MQANALEELRRLITYMNTSGIALPAGVAAACAAAVASVPSQSFLPSTTTTAATAVGPATLPPTSGAAAGPSSHQDSAINSTRSPDSMNEVVTSACHAASAMDAASRGENVVSRGPGCGGGGGSDMIIGRTADGSLGSSVGSRSNNSSPGTRPSSRDHLSDRRQQTRLLCSPSPDSMSDDMLDVERNDDCGSRRSSCSS